MPSLDGAADGEQDGTGYSGESVLAHISGTSKLAGPDAIHATGHLLQCKPLLCLTITPSV